MLLTSSIHFFSPEFFLIFSSGGLLVFVALRPAKNYSLSLISHQFTAYSLLIASILLYEIMPYELISPIAISNPLIVSVKLFLVLACGFFSFLLRRGGLFHINELGLLLIMGMVGIMFILSSQDLLLLYLGLELQSLTFYILASLNRNGEFSTEAGFKYFILGAVSSGIFLLGCAYTYLLCGDTSYAISDISLSLSLSSSLGYLLILISLLWKLGAAPLHMWVPDVYEGAPNIITAFFALFPKIGIITALITLLTGPMQGIPGIQSLIITTSILSLMVGSIGALNQSKLKRVLAYSAISHTGFLLAGLSTNSIEGYIAVIIYNFIYIIMGFNTLALLASILPGSSNWNYLIAGLSRYNLILAISFAISLLSLAGIPPLAGFITKYYVLLATLNSDLYILTGFAVLSSVISAFFYLQLVKIMFFKDSGSFNWKVLADFSTNHLLPLNSSISLIFSLCFYIILSALIFPLPFSFVQDIILLSLF